MHVVVQNIRRTETTIADAFAGYGVASVHEAQGRKGLLAPDLNPIYAGAHIAGNAVTVSVPPCDNWMIQAGIEQCQAGGPCLVQQVAQTGSDMTDTLHRNAQTLERVCPELRTRGGLDPLQAAQSGPR